MKKLQVVLLAAGEGTRMKSKKNKMLHEICGRTLLGWVLEAAGALSDRKPIAVVGANEEAVKDVFGDELEYALQSERLGSGHAAMMALPLLDKNIPYTLIAAGDMPLLTRGTLEALHLLAQDYDGALLSARLEDPAGYGRVVRAENGDVTAIVEHKDANEEQLLIDEVNASVYCFKTDKLMDALGRLDNDNAQGEYYLTDIVGIIVSDGGRVGALTAGDCRQCLGVNDRVQLYHCEKIMRRRINEAHMRAGVTLIDPENTYIGAQVKIGADTVIYPGNVLEGHTLIGEDCVLYPGSRIVDSVLADGVRIQNSVLLEAGVGKGSTIGPYAYLRPGSRVGEKARIGDFVEVKNAEIGDGTKVSHLTYIGDGRLGKNCNVGCGTVFVNYDGHGKYFTDVGDNVFIGCNTNLIAPVKVGDGAYIAAGSTITDDVPEDALAIARSRQVVKEGWAANRREQKEKK
ncbi:MAG: bifunctional UDP-N-acetylglucosamine diphosphorylase/glucosamine-1-phosphate N-acetyltransferase GlmU [Christensenellales bacterium]|jgi:bifunctional UDP-N-acetylglucosamine pyrophosphorylase/glucosamine-1-phosphate N-acetyltransferase